MTASTTALITQPAFAPQLTANPSPVGTSNTALQHGYMIWSDPMTSFYSAGGPLGDGRDVINFLFNPSTVTSDYNIGNASLQAAMMYQVPGDSGNLLAPLFTQTVSWQLYFDRTFELLYGGNASSAVNDPTVIGVQADVYAFMQFTGVLASLDNQQATQVLGSAGASGSSAPSTTGGIMMMIPSYVYFGNASQQYANSGNTAANNAAVATQLAYFGFVSEWSVEYTHWTQNMVPIRAVISVTFTMLPNPPAGTGTATWNDIQKLNGSYVAAVPYAPNVTPKTPVFNR
jgi:hypothetical protein